jgi:sulfhydrogenase subunit alpha
MNESQRRKIQIGHLGRVEGHGGIDVEIRDGKLIRVNFDIYEGSRFYEALIIGKHYTEVPAIVSRVCAICSASHILASLQAVENAFSVEISPITDALRRLLFYGGIIESHALHVFLLALPDFLGFSGALSMADHHPDEVARALRLKKLGNTVQSLVGGRAIHPINPVIGGFGRVPKRDELEHLREQLQAGLKDALATVKLLESIEIPAYADSPSIFAALRPSDSKEAFSFFGDRIVTSLGDDEPISAFRTICHERVVRHSHAKQSLYSNKPFMVGALARLNLNHQCLSGEAVDVLNKLLPPLPSNNTLLNTWAQMVELIHSIEASLEIIDSLLSEKLSDSERPNPFCPMPSAGTGACEAPRGMLFHHYVFDQDGCIVDADIVTPTAQNLANVEKDFGAVVKHALDEPREAVVRKLEMVARAYDPCISCAVHLIHDSSAASK